MLGLVVACLGVAPPSALRAALTFPLQDLNSEAGFRVYWYDENSMGASDATGVLGQPCPSGIATWKILDEQDNTLHTRSSKWCTISGNSIPLAGVDPGTPYIFRVDSSLFGCFVGGARVGNYIPMGWHGFTYPDFVIPVEASSMGARPRRLDVSPTLTRSYVSVIPYIGESKTHPGLAASLNALPFSERDRASTTTVYLTSTPLPGAPPDFVLPYTDGVPGKLTGGLAWVRWGERLGGTHSPPSHYLGEELGTDSLLICIELEGYLPECLELDISTHTGWLYRPLLVPDPESQRPGYGIGDFVGTQGILTAAVNMSLLEGCHGALSMRQDRNGDGTIDAADLVLAGMGILPE